MTTISSGQTTYVKHGQTVSGYTVLSGGDLTVEFGAVSTDTILSGGKESLTGSAFGTTVLAGGILAVSSGATPRFSIIDTGGAIYVGNGGLDYGTTISSGGHETVFSGGSATDQKILSGGTSIVSSGGSSDDYLVTGGTLIVEGEVAHSYIQASGIATVLSGGVLFDSVVDSGSLIVGDGGGAPEMSVGTFRGVSGAALEAILSGGSASETMISPDGVQIVSSGGTSYYTVDEGSLYASSGAIVTSAEVYGRAIFSSGAIVTDLQVYGDVMDDGGPASSGLAYAESGVVISGGVESGQDHPYDMPAVQAGGYLILTSGASSIDNAVEIASDEIVEGGAVASDTTVSDGFIHVSAGGVVDGANIHGEAYYDTEEGIYVNFPAEVFLSSGGLESATRVGSDGIDAVEGGRSYAAVILSSGQQDVSQGGLAIGTVIDAGGLMSVLSGGLTGGLTLSGGTAVISGEVSAGAVLGFAGSGGEAALDDLPQFGGVISGFGAGDTIDLGGFNTSSAAESARFVEAPGGASGVLTVTSGGTVASLSFDGSYATSNFALSGDGAGDTFVTYVPNGGTAAPSVAQLHRLVNAIAGFARPAGETAPREAEERHHPILALPR